MRMLMTSGDVINSMGEWIRMNGGNLDLQTFAVLQKLDWSLSPVPIFTYTINIYEPSK